MVLSPLIEIFDRSGVDVAVRHTFRQRPSDRGVQHPIVFTLHPTEVGVEDRSGGNLVEGQDIVHDRPSWSDGRHGLHPILGFHPKPMPNLSKAFTSILKGREAQALIDQDQPDWIVLLGDILPDFSIVPGQGNRLTCQRDHWELYATNFESGPAVTTFLRGNHQIDGFNVPQRHRRLPACFEEKVIRLEGIPAEFGAWGWSREWVEADLARELSDQINEAPKANIVLSHVPPYGCLDEVQPGTHIGHRPLAAWLESGSIGPHSLVLCGHVHESLGLARCRDSLVVNMAEGSALLDDQNEEGGWNRWSVLHLESMESCASRLRTLAEDRPD